MSTLSPKPPPQPRAEGLYPNCPQRHHHTSSLSPKRPSHPPSCAHPNLQSHCHIPSLKGCVPSVPPEQPSHPPNHISSVLKATIIPPRCVPAVPKAVVTPPHRGTVSLSGLATLTWAEAQLFHAAVLIFTPVLQQKNCVRWDSHQGKKARREAAERVNHKAVVHVLHTANGELISWQPSSGCFKSVCSNVALKNLTASSCKQPHSFLTLASNSHKYRYFNYAFCQGELKTTSSYQITEENKVSHIFILKKSAFYGVR